MEDAIECISDKRAFFKKKTKKKRGEEKKSSTFAAELLLLQLGNPRGAGALKKKGEKNKVKGGRFTTD